MAKDVVARVGAERFRLPLGVDGRRDSRPTAAPGTLSLLSTSIQTDEGTAFNLVLSRSGGSDGAVAADWAIAGVTTTPQSGTVTWSEGDTANKTVAVTAGMVAETHAAAVTLSNARRTDGGQTQPVIGVGSGTLTVNDVQPPASWNLPATINVPQSGSVDVRQYLTNGSNLTISVTNLPTGVTYNSGLERLEGAASGTSSGTATFTAGSVVDTATVALVEAPASEYTPTLWVNAATGSDSYTRAQIRAGGGSIQWATIGRACWGTGSRNSPVAGEAAEAGDVVSVAAGTYSTAGTGQRWGVAYKTAVSGAEGAPIIFVADGTVVLTLSSSSGPVIGAGGFDGGNRDYIEWIGFTVNEVNAPSAPDTGVAVLAGTVGSAIRRCLLDGNGDAGHGDNHPGVRVEWATGAVVEDCRITNFLTSGVNGANGAGIQVYNSDDTLFQHNTIYGCGSGIFWKALTNLIGPNVGRFNHIYDCTHGIIVHRSPNTATDPSLVYQNLVHDCSYAGITLWGFDDATGPKNAILQNNTVYNCGVQGQDAAFMIQGSSLPPNAGNISRNNIVSECPAYVFNFMGQYGTIGDTSRFDAEHNLYHDYWRFAFIYTNNNVSLATWQSSYGQDAASPAAITSDPLFVNPAAGDFRLQAGSPALTLGRDYLNLSGNGVGATIPAGCYITGDEIMGRRV